MPKTIGDMDLEALRTEWGQRYGAPPSLRSVPIMRMLLAWRVQAGAYGGLDAQTRRLIERTGRDAPRVSSSAAARGSPASGTVARSRS
jgi:hypothetical protein